MSTIPEPPPLAIHDYLRVLSKGGDDKHQALKHIRELRGFTTAQAGKAAGMAIGAISEWENGFSWPRSIRRIIEYLRGIGVSSGDIDEHFTRSQHLLMQGTTNEIEVAGQMEALLRSEAKDDIHQFEGLAFDAAIPRILCTLLARAAATAEPSLVKQAKDWWDDWKVRDGARLSAPKQVGESEAKVQRSWTAGAINPKAGEEPATGVTPHNDGSAVTHVPPKD